MRSLAAVWAFCLVLIPLSLEAAPMKEADVTLEPTGELAVAAFHMVVPEGEAPRALLVLLPGSNGDGRSLADSPEWRSWAAEQHLALLGCFLRDKPVADEWIENYARAGNGSGQALLTAIDRLSVMLRRRELAQLPLALVGASAGGQFAYEFTCWRPERVVAFVAHKGGVYFTHLAPAEARAVPGLFFIGGRDLVYRRLSLAGIWGMGRRAGAHWALVDEPEAGHEEVAFASLSRLFLEDALSLRLKGLQLQSAVEGSGWLIGMDIPTPCPESKDPKGQASTGWLPGRASAEAASRFVPKF